PRIRGRRRIGAGDLEDPHPATPAACSLAGEEMGAVGPPEGFEAEGPQRVLDLDRPIAQSALLEQGEVDLAEQGAAMRIAERRLEAGDDVELGAFPSMFMAF